MSILVKISDFIANIFYPDDIRHNIVNGERLPDNIDSGRNIRNNTLHINEDNSLTIRRNNDANIMINERYNYNKKQILYIALGFVVISTGILYRYRNKHKLNMISESYKMFIIAHDRYFHNDANNIESFSMIIDSLNDINKYLRYHHIYGSLGLIDDTYDKCRNVYEIIIKMESMELKGIEHRILNILKASVYKDVYDRINLDVGALKRAKYEEEFLWSIYNILTETYQHDNNEDENIAEGVIFYSERNQYCERLKARMKVIRDEREEQTPRQDDDNDELGEPDQNHFLEYLRDALNYFERVEFVR